MVLLDLLNLVLYCVQQLGVTLGVGAETVLIFEYLSAMRDGVVDDSESRMARVVHRVLRLGIFLIVLSGLAIAGIHYAGGRSDILLEPAFLFKWTLIIVLLLFSVGVNIKWPLTWAEGFAAGTWFALFLIHILAPVSHWLFLFELYVVWMIGFLLCWGALVYSLRGGSSSGKAIKPPLPKPAPVIAAAPAQKPPPQAPKPVPSPPPIPPKPVTPPPAPPKPTAPPPAPKPAPAAPVITPNVPGPTTPPNLPTPPKLEPVAITMKVEDPDHNPDLPAIRVMPKTAEELKNQNQNRASVVKLD